MRAMVALVAASGCYHPSPPSGAPCANDDGCPAGQQCVAGICGGMSSMTDADTSDAPMPDAVSLCATWHARHFDPCTLPMPLGDLNLTASLVPYSWDTSKPELRGKANTVIPVATTVLAQADGPEVLVASVGDFTLEAGATLDLDGTRALLVAVWGTATIAGEIDADAHFSVPGPGGAAAESTATGCGGPPTGDFGAAGQPATGGGGGAFQGGGGRGGNSGGLGGTAVGASTKIQGGCAGGGGGAGTSAAGARGAGGGAIQITARESITVTSSGRIHAGGGGGGGGGANSGGGGGGGAGGYLGFDAPVVTIGGVLAANGGGGGGGANNLDANGSPGENGTPNAIAARGGDGATCFGTLARGGDGSASGALFGRNGGSSTCGGGGGGGGAGYILVWSPALVLTGTASPPASAGP